MSSQEPQHHPRKVRIARFAGDGTAAIETVPAIMGRANTFRPPSNHSRGWSRFALANIGDN
jgi:hypothetical protein